MSTFKPGDMVKINDPLVRGLPGKVISFGVLSNRVLVEFTMNEIVRRWYFYPKQLEKLNPSENKNWHSEIIGGIMDPLTGKLYTTKAEALQDGVKNPVEISGSEEDVQKISNLIKSDWTKKQKKARNKKNKRSKASRKKNRS